MFVGHDYVVTVRHGQGSSLHQSRLDLEGRTGVLTHGPSAVVYAVCDKVVDDYEEVAASLQEDVDEVESSVFSPDRTDDASRIYVLKREVAEMRRAVMPLKEPMRQFADGRVEGIDDDARPFFADVYDHVARTAEVIDGLDNLLTAAFQGHLARISRAAERGHAQDLRGRRPGRRPDADRRRVRHELRPHARAAVAVRLRLRARADGRDRCWRCGCSSRSPAGSSPARSLGRGLLRAEPLVEPHPGLPHPARRLVHQAAQRVLGALEGLGVAGRGLLRGVADRCGGVVLASG